MHMLGHAQMEAAMPPRSVQHQDDLLLGTGSGRTGKRRQLCFEERDRDTSRQMKEGAAGGGMDKSHDVAPDKAMLHDRDWSLANGRPDPPLDWLEADTMLVGGPELHGAVGKGRRYRS